MIIHPQENRFCTDTYRNEHVAVETSLCKTVVKVPLAVQWGVVGEGGVRGCDSAGAGLTSLADSLWHAQGGTASVPGTTDIKWTYFTSGSDSRKSVLTDTRTAWLQVWSAAEMAFKGNLSHLRFPARPQRKVSGSETFEAGQLRSIPRR